MEHMYSNQTSNRAKIKQGERETKKHTYINKTCENNQHRNHHLIYFCNKDDKNKVMITNLSMKAPEHSFSCGVQHNNKIDNCNSLNCNSLNRILCLNLFKIILPKVSLCFDENLQKRKKNNKKKR